MLTTDFCWLLGHRNRKAEKTSLNCINASSHGAEKSNRLPIDPVFRKCFSPRIRHRDLTFEGLVVLVKSVNLLTKGMKAVDGRHIGATQLLTGISALFSCQSVIGFSCRVQVGQPCLLQPRLWIFILVSSQPASRIPGHQTFHKRLSSQPSAR